MPSLDNPVGRKSLATPLAKSSVKISLKVNGKKVNEAHGCDVRCGKIGFQSEGGEIHFRKITISPVK